jgi:hypothetical protein
MKIKLDKESNKPFLPDGRHLVEITHIEEGISENKKVPFFACRFENEEGFVTQRFYNSTAGLPIIVALFKSLGMEVDEKTELNTKDLVGKSLTITVGERTYADPDSGNERTLKQATDFESATKAANQ